MTTLRPATPVQAPLFNPCSPEGRAVAEPGPIQTRGAPIAMLGVPFDNVTTAETVALVERMVRSGLPHYLATANVDFLVQALHDVELGGFSLKRTSCCAMGRRCSGRPAGWATLSRNVSRVLTSCRCWSASPPNVVTGCFSSAARRRRPRQR